jgi:hypothetical protein
MAQLCDFAIDPERPRDWHLYFLRELLDHVSTEKPSERRYAKWLRERKVFDRKLVAFCEKLVGIERVREQPPALGEVARDLLDEIEKAKKKAEAEAEKQRQALSRKPGRDGPRGGPSPAAPAPPRPRAANPDEELDEEKAFADKAPEPVATDDPFVKGILERAVELNQYLAKFVFRELGADFLAVNELYRRISTSAYVGKRPALPQFEVWVRWQEWLGGMVKVGFRHKATTAGQEQGKALKDVPDAELILPSKDDSLALEPVAAAVEESPVTNAPLVANAPTGRRSLEVTEDADDEEGDASSEGLDMPPAPATPSPPEQGFWAEKVHDDAPAPRGPLPDPVIAPKPFSEIMRELTDAAAAMVPPASPPAPPPSTETRPPVVERPPLPAPIPERLAPPPAAPSSDVAPTPLQLLVGWWRHAGRPGERFTAAEAGLDLSLYRGPQRGLVVFKLLALATFLETSPRGRSLALFRELAARSAFEALFHDEALERVVDLDATRPLPPARALVALLRYRKALKQDALVAKLDQAREARELARTLRREVTGDALSTGVVLVVREMAKAGHWRAPGVDALGCVPWSEVRASAWRIGLLGSPEASTFEDLLAMSEALTRVLGAEDEHEVPLLAFHARPSIPEREAFP